MGPTRPTVKYKTWMRSHMCIMLSYRISYSFVFQKPASKPGSQRAIDANHLFLFIAHKCVHGPHLSRPAELSGCERLPATRFWCVSSHRNLDTASPLPPHTQLLHTFKFNAPLIWTMDFVFLLTSWLYFCHSAHWIRIESNGIAY